MPSTLEACEKYFGTKDLYQIFSLDKNATVAEIKKAYYKQALKVHPDRVEESEKIEATEKFKVLAKIHEVFTDDDRRKLYDSQGIIDDEEDDKFGASWLEAFKNLFKPISDSDIDNYRKEYIGSELERTDVKKAYVNGLGCWNYMLEHIPFMGVEDEPRFMEMVLVWINSNEVPEHKIFIDEPKSKKHRRHKKYARESKEAEQISEKLKKQKSAEGGDDSMNDLAKQIALKSQNRESNFNSFMDKLMEKYGDEDDDDVVDFSKLTSKRKTTKVNKLSTKKTDSPIRKGRVSKRNK